MVRNSPYEGLKGNTLRVYLFLFKVERCDIKQSQRALNFNSPSLAQYHLEKLVSMGLAGRDERTGEFMLVKEVRVGALEQFMKLGTFIVPRLLLYAVMITVIFAYFVLFIAHLSVTTYTIWTFFIGGFSLVTIWYETIRAWRNTP